MNLKTERYLEQLRRWPTSGRHIMAQFDETSVVVYQAYRPSIGSYAAKNGYFGGDFKLSRMSWIKPNFLWMMYRSGWGTKPDQEITLAVRIKRSEFDSILAQAVRSTFVPNVYRDHEHWRERVANSSVRLQWDPDHDRAGNKQERRAIQLGLNGDVLMNYSKEWIVDIEDISEFVESQRDHAAKSGWEKLITPSEEVYPVTDQKVVNRLQLSESTTQGKVERLRK